MKSSLVRLVVIVALCGQAWAVPAPVQSKSATTTVAATTVTTAAFTSSTTSTNLIAVLVQTDGTLAATAVTDSVGNSYAQCGTSLVSASAYTMAVFYAKNITGGASFTVTAHTTATADTDVAAEEFSGLDTASPCDQTHSAEDSTVNTNPSSGDTPTTTVANEALFGGWGSNAAGAVTFTAGTSWTARETIGNTTDGHSSGMQTRIVSATGAYHSDVVLSDGTGTKLLYIATFKGASGTATCPATRTLLGVGC